MPSRATQQTARILMLQKIRDWLDTDEKPNPNSNALEIQAKNLQRFGQEDLGWDEIETSRLFKRLVREGYIRTYRDETTFLEINGVVQFAWIEDLTDSGDALLGVLSDPNKELLNSLDIISDAIRALDSGEVPEEEKSIAEIATSELKQFIRGLSPAAAMQLLKAILASRGIHLT